MVFIRKMLSKYCARTTNRIIFQPGQFRIVIRLEANVMNLKASLSTILKTVVMVSFELPEISTRVSGNNQSIA